MEQLDTRLGDDTPPRPASASLLRSLFRPAPLPASEYADVDNHAVAGEILVANNQTPGADPSTTVLVSEDLGPVESFQRAASDDPDGNRRYFERVPLRRQVRFFAPWASEALSGRIADVSRSGMFIRTRQILPEGTPVSCGFYSEDDPEQPIMAKGRVVRLAPRATWLGSGFGRGLGGGFGVRFSAVSTSYRKLIDHLLD